MSLCESIELDRHFLEQKGYRVFKRTGMNVLFESADA